MIVLEHGILTQEELDTILLPENMIKPVKLDIKSLSGARTGARLIWCTSRSSIPTLGMCGTNVIASRHIAFRGGMTLFYTVGPIYAPRDASR